MIKQSKLLKFKSKILSNFFHEKYGLKFGEFNNTTGTKRVKFPDKNFGRLRAYGLTSLSENIGRFYHF